MSTSALLVSSITKTDIYDNIKTMFKTSLIPFAATCIIYLLLGSGVESEYDVSGVKALFEENFNLSIFVVLPAAAILILSVFKLNVKINMGVSIIIAVIICLSVQKLSIGEIINISVNGFYPLNPDMNSLMSGGGILSMANVFFIVCISSCHSGIFKGTGMLGELKKLMEKLRNKTTSYFCVLVSAILTGLISCNQSLTIMLTHQLCDEIEPDNKKMASYLEDTAVVIAPMVPWSIAGAVPLTSVGAPTESILLAVYLYILPLWNLFISFYKSKRKKNIK